MSATALLQKAAQLGVTSNNTITTSAGNLIRPHHQNPQLSALHMMGTAAAGFFGSREGLASSYGTNKAAAGHANLTPGCMEMMATATASDTSGFFDHHQGFNGGGRENADIEGLNTRDFLSLTASFSSSKGFSQNGCWPP